MKNCLFLHRALFVAVIGLATSGSTLSLHAADAAPIEAVQFETIPGGQFLLRGPDARLQLLVSAKHAGNANSTDATHNVEYVVEPQGVLTVDATGMAKPVADGQATVTAKTPDGKTCQATVLVKDFSNAPPINFTNQIVPIFTKLGCNGGGCHGKQGGQNGFKLGLLGFFPEDDYEFLVKESRGRRINVPAPSKSLLLTKPVGQSPHGGGKRMDVDSDEYRVLSRWIEQGMPFGAADAPTVAAIKCVPEGRVMGRDANQQIACYATYTDGYVEDVTRMTLYEPNDSQLAESGKTGLVHTLDLAGEVAIMARYQGQVSTFRATIPLGAPIAGLPPVRNFIDEAVFNKLKLLGIPASPVCDDTTFLRRVYIDITGTMPTEAEVRDFQADSDAAKRDKLIDRLLDSPAYADYFANKWNMVLRNKRKQPDDVAGTYAFRQWIWDSLYDNKPYDKMVGEILTASGDSNFNPPVIWYREVAQNNEQVEDVAQLFLGVRIQCARCHHHPFEKWSQDDYYHLSAFFSRIGKKDRSDPTTKAGREKRIFHNEGQATAQNPRTGKTLAPAGLATKPLEVPPEQDPRTLLVEWMTAKDNVFFARSLTNRYWKHFFDRGIVEPEDDIRETNPPTNPELLAALSKHFIDSNFDLKSLVRTICQSSTYQLSAIPNEYNQKDKQNFSRYYPKRLSAEVLYDGFHQVTATNERFGGMPEGTKATQLPDSSVAPYFLKVFGQPQGDTACECERSQEANLAQSLHLLNSAEVQNKVAAGNGRAATLANDKARPDEEKIRELYRWVYSREPVSDELGIALAHIAKHKDNPKIAYEDIVWALINTKEFLFNH
jgi:hypothetical protein